MVQKNISDAGYMEGNTFLVRLGFFFVLFFLILYIIPKNGSSQHLESQPRVARCLHG